MVEPKLKPRAYSSDDYGGLTANNVSFYYGYEETACTKCLARNCKEHPDDHQEWCFLAKWPNHTVTIASSRLGAEDEFNISENLLLGIGWLFAKYRLEPISPQPLKLSEEKK